MKAKKIWTRINLSASLEKRSLENVFLKREVFCGEGIDLSGKKKKDSIHSCYLIEQDERADF
jgi:hypothetical protein